ncbi:MAG: RluA family pseudouridine synthase [Alphaproteobacteria bacterium]|nr:RluA family pseudouridine synthase [Alphaproteobacteria bacterium]MBN2675156.1 RluA family pseudouridine synthase [Alphaproteobacteria bacterium]
MQKPIEVYETEEGTRLLRWFLRHYSGMSASEFYKLCRGGQIRLNSSRCRGKEILRAGDIVRVPPTLTQYQQDKIKKTESGNRFTLADLEKLRKCIIHDDEDIVIFNKPAGLAVQGGTGIVKSVDKMAAEMFPYDKISLVHRLDKETSGVLIVAKNQRSAQILSKEFQDKTAQKEYLALLMGNVSPRSGVIDNFMTKGHILEEGENVLPGVKAYRAITEYKVISEIAGTLSWVSFSPKTGRTHQLRIHSAFSLGAPIIGDTLYNKEQRLDDTLNSLLATKNLFLFAYKLSFRHPGSGKIMTIRAELPNFMLPVIKFLEFKIPE